MYITAVYTSSMKHNPATYAYMHICIYVYTTKEQRCRPVLTYLHIMTHGTNILLVLLDEVGQ